MSDKKKFGLIMSKRADASKIKKHSIFSEDESDEDQRRNKRPKIPQKKISSKSKVKTEIIEDPSIYEYDNIYDEMKLKQAESIAPKEKQNSRYIETLMKAADKRKKEYERRLDKKIQVEREKEGDKYKDKEAFVTSSYKKKMEELEEEEERERRKDMLNDMMDVTKQNDISGFYRHFLKQTVGEEKVPEFGERKIKKEIVSQDDSSQNFQQSAKSFKNIDQDSDGVEIDSDDDENLINKKYAAEDMKRKRYAHSQSSRDLVGSSKNIGQDKVEIDSDEDKNEGNKTPKTDDKIEKSYSHSQSSNSFPGISKDYNNIDEDSDGVEIDSEDDEKHNTVGKGKKSHSDSSSDSDDLGISQKDFSDAISKKGKEEEYGSSHRPKSLSSRHTRIPHRKSCESSNSDALSSDNEQDGSVRKMKDSIKKQKSDINNKKNSRHDTDSSSDDSDDVVDEKVTDGNKANKKSPKRNIYAKRTVGSIFAEAQAKYFQRMALRDSGI